MSDQPEITPKIKLNLTHSILHSRIPEVRFDLNEQIAEIKRTCEKKFGTKDYSMQLVLQDLNGNFVVAMNEDDRTLDYYCPQEYYTIHVIDTDPNSITKELEDLSQVEKYEISEEDYDKLPNTVRKFKEEFLKKQQEAEHVESLGDDYMQTEAEAFAIGNRCKLIDNGNIGTVEYVGLVPEINKGYFIGIRLDQAFGTNNGSINGNKYFECLNKYGIFVRPNKVEVGDFPVYNDDDEI